MASMISSRGADFMRQRPAFLEVLNDLWHPEANPSGVINIGLAENSLIHEELVEFINSQPRANLHALTYGDGFSGSKRLCQALCQFLNRKFAPLVPLSLPHLRVTSGVSNAVECCAWSLFNPGDYVLIGRPYWTTFRHLFGTRPGVNVLEVSFGSVDPFSQEAVEVCDRAYARALEEGKHVKAILLCSPSNPLGRCYSKDVLQSYMTLCKKRQMHLISDEIYGLSVWDNKNMTDNVGFTSVLSIDAAQFMDPGMVHVVWGLSKDFGATGLRIGCLISQNNPALLHSAEGISLFNFPSSLADQTTASLLMNEELVDHYVSLSRSRLAESHLRVSTFLRHYGIPFQQSNAALFVWINLGAIVKDKPLSDNDILAKIRAARVYITSGATYACEEPGWFRVVIAHPWDILETGLKRIVDAVL